MINKKIKKRKIESSSEDDLDLQSDDDEDFSQVEGDSDVF